MEKIKCLVKDIREELCDAEKYAKKAAKHKDTESNYASIYRSLAEQELSHADKLHQMVVDEINRAKSSGVQVPAAMQAVWDWEHENMIECVSSIKELLKM